MKNVLMITALLLSAFLTLSSKQVFAADNCTIIYGGGEIKCQATISADKTITVSPAEQTATNPATTKGGLPVYQPTPTAQTPGTGPEALSLISLIPAAAAGIYLRRKTK